MSIFVSWKRNEGGLGKICKAISPRTFHSILTQRLPNRKQRDYPPKTRNPVQNATEIEDLQELDEVVRDAMNAVIELHEDTGKDFPSGLITEGTKSPVWFESLIFAGQ